MFFFKSAYTIPQELNKFIPDTSNNQSISFYPIEEHEIIRVSKKLRDKLTSGPDNIPSFFVKDCIGALIKPLLIIFNLALQNGTFPDIWKEAKVCPIFKKGNKSEIVNYRPVSILCNFSKVFEIVLYNRIFPVVQSLISPNQHGFFSKRSTITNLTVMTQFISEVLDNNGQVDVIYTDFSKAFDKVDHNILLKKLFFFGFTTQAITFIRSYLVNRMQFVCYNGFCSEKYLASSGVPQGSNLGPLLFVLFINDIFTHLLCPTLGFADDFKLYVAITNLEDCIYLQSQVNKLSEWCYNSGLYLNVNKCNVISYTKKNNFIQFEYVCNDITLNRCNIIKDLGVIFVNKLSFVNHIEKIISDGMKAYGFLIRNCKTFSNINALKSLYYAYIRSKMEYGSIVWSPYYMCHIRNIEQVQRKFLKFLIFKIDGLYPERGVSNLYLYERLNIASLEARRNCASIKFLFKLIHSDIDCSDILHLINFNIPTFNSRRNVLFRSKRPHTNLMKKAPITVMCNNWNIIGNECDIFSQSLKSIISTSIKYFVN